MQKLAVLFVSLFLFSLVNASESEIQLQSKAEAGEAEAQFLLAVKFEKGRGVPKDPEKAVYWYLQAAERNHVRAQRNLGLYYLRNALIQESSKNLSESTKWLGKAAEKGDAISQRLLGKIMMTDARSKSGDTQEAAYWLRKAADQGDAEAQFGLASKKWTPI